MTIHSYSNTRAPTAPRVIIQTENTRSITSLTQTYNKLQHSKVKNTLSLTTTVIQQTFPQTPTQSVQQTYKQTCTIYIHILSLCVLSQEVITKYCTPLPHISSSEEILTRLTRRTLAKL